MSGERVFDEWTSHEGGADGQKTKTAVLDVEPREQHGNLAM
jgi:hypothetical protein